jgi:hypothetical protein
MRILTPQRSSAEIVSEILASQNTGRDVRIDEASRPIVEAHLTYPQAIGLCLAILHRLGADSEYHLRFSDIIEMFSVEGVAQDLEEIPL